MQASALADVRQLGSFTSGEKAGSVTDNKTSYIGITVWRLAKINYQLGDYYSNLISSDLVHRIPQSRALSNTSVLTFPM